MKMAILRGMQYSHSVANDLHSNLPNVFLAGCTKSASTWLWRCCVEHPEIFVPTSLDRINFFSIHYHKGFEWYKRYYEGVNGQKVIIDPTPEYIKDPFAAERIHKFRPDAKFIFVFRNPIDRAYSLWWHQKRKGRINYHFNDVLERKRIGSFPLYDDWLVSGFYLHWLQGFLNLFPREQIKVMIYEDLETDAQGFLQEVFEFLQVNKTFVPSITNTKVNVGKKTETSLFGNIKKLVRPTSPYESGMDEHIRQELQQIFEPHNQKLGNFLGKDLSFWK
jgi:hypothetical protein